MRRAAYTVCVLLAVSWVSDAQPRVNADAALTADFLQRVASYVKLHKEAAAGLPTLKPGTQSEGIPEYERLLRERIRELRAGAKQGDICTPAISAELRRLIGMAMRGADEKRIRESLRRAEPVVLSLRVNDPFPDDLPLQSTPPTLLLNLPGLPPEVDYRIAGNSLVLRDATANMVVDFVPNALGGRK